MTGVDILKAIGLDNASLGLFNRFIAKKAYKLGKMNSKAKKIVKNKWHVITESGENIPADQGEVLVKLSSGKIRSGYYYSFTATEKGWYLVHPDPNENDISISELGLFVVAWRELPIYKPNKN